MEDRRPTEINVDKVLFDFNKPLKLVGKFKNLESAKRSDWLRLLRGSAQCATQANTQSDDELKHDSKKP